MTKWQKTKLFLKTILRPQITVTVDRGSKGYEVTIERIFLGKIKAVKVQAKEAVETEMNLMELLKF